MGRKLKYKTEEEKRISINEKSMRYYWKNQKKIKQKNLKKYYENKRNIQNSE